MFRGWIVRETRTGLGTGLRVIAAGLPLVLLTGTGCLSLWVTKRPPPGPIDATPPARCESSNAAPVADTVLAVAAAGLATALFVESAEHAGEAEGMVGDPTSGAAFVGGLLLATGVAIPLGVSAGVGYSRTAECREVKATQLSCTSGVEESCAALRRR
jgi:hypothetical protein